VCLQDTLVVKVMSPALGLDDELGTLEITMDAIRQASQVRGEGRGVSGEEVAERAP
jgi:hypothetical protein